MDFTTKAMEKRIADRKAFVLQERGDLFRQFREGGWQINVVDGGSRQFTILPDITMPSAGTAIHFRVKMPGAAAVRVTTIAALQRLVKGVGA
jgi:hypothetical protein